MPVCAMHIVHHNFPILNYLIYQTPEQCDAFCRLHMGCILGLCQVYNMPSMFYKGLLIVNCDYCMEVFLIVMLGLRPYLCGAMATNGLVVHPPDDT